MFRKNHIVAVDIGASKLVVADFVVERSSGVELVNYGIARYGVESANDKDASAYIVSNLRRVMQERGISHGGKVYLGVSGQAVFPRFVKLPPVTPDKIHQIVRYEAEQNVPFPIEDVVWDYQLIEAEGGDQNVMLVAVKVDNVTRITDCAVAAGMEPELVDVAPMALYNTVRYNYPDLPGCAMILDIGAKSSNLVFIEGSRIFSRSVPVAGNTITQEIAKEFEVSFPEAEELKMEHGFVAFGGVYSGPDSEEGDRVSKVARNVITRLHAEVNRSINFYRSQQGGSPPELILLAGGASVIPHLDTFFREKLKAEVEFLNPFTNIPVGGGLSSEQVQADLHMLGEVTGLALRAALTCPVEINLIPPDLMAKKTMRRRQPFFVLSAVGLVFIMLCWWVYFHHMQKMLAQLSDTVEEKIGGLEQTYAELNKVLAKREKTEEKAGSLVSLVGRRSQWVDIVADIHDSMFEGMWIRRMIPKAGGDRKVIGHLQIRAVAFDDKLREVTAASESTAMEVYRDRLKKKKSFTENVKIVAQPPSEIKGVREFTLEAELASPIELK